MAPQVHPAPAQRLKALMNNQPIGRQQDKEIGGQPAIRSN
jgi:hypothetical protein